MDVKGFSERVRIGMLKKGVNQAQLAKKIGTTQTMVNRWLIGSNEPRISAVEKIAKQLGTHPAILMYGDEVKTAKKPSTKGKE